ncbi:hypothetical protein [Longicatena caecimuris]|uniref:Uncharacterized protein n=1 Tax=Longicatena caecimuris TaxID=1796635 RepID=A0A4R3T1D1_9FIRM|nr:hypothetical protein [Longicatena caecimuris]MCR1871027.1 hypothetical protein [Longicatena caecimuris]TCU54739.1 hypothetical protein EDD61_12329 [Longicatena caecimuris]
MSYRWESEKIAQWRLKARHGGLDENERLLYEDYLQSCALAEADVNASKARSMGRLSERRLKKGAIRRGVISLALVALIGMYAMTGCKLSESILLVPYTTYEIGYKLTGELPDTNKVLSSIANTMRLLSGGGSWDLGSFIQSGRASVARLASGQVPPDECFFDEVVSRLRGTSDMTEVHRHIWSDEALWNFEVYLKQKEDSSYDPGTYDGNGYDGRQIIEDLGGGYGGNAVKDLAED